MTTTEPQIVSYLSLVPEAWRTDPAITGAVVKCYSSGIAEYPDLQQRAVAAVKSVISPLGGKFFIGFGSLPNEEPVQTFDELITLHGDEIRLNLYARSRRVPAGHYAFLAIPLGGNDESYLIRRTDSIRGLLTLVAGHTAMLDLVFEQRFDLSQPDQVSSISKTVEAHIFPATWEVFKKKTWRAAEQGFIVASDELKARAELSFSFVARSANVLDHAVRYANTWIALEIAAGGHKAVREFLNQLHPNFANEAKRFIDMRNALFHQGQRPTFEQADERFLCACILALLLKPLGIESPEFNNLIKEQLERSAP